MDITLTKQEIQYLIDSMEAHRSEGHYGDSQNYIHSHLDVSGTKVPYNIKREDDLETKLKVALSE